MFFEMFNSSAGEDMKWQRILDRWRSSTKRMAGDDSP
jgi:hypothetical protein